MLARDGTRPAVFRWLQYSINRSVLGWNIEQPLIRPWLATRGLQGRLAPGGIRLFSAQLEARGPLLASKRA
jgi:hypothetical protein